MKIKFPLQISNMNVSQSGLRLPVEEILSMIKFAKSGKFWTLQELESYSLKSKKKDFKLIQIHILEDFNLIVHDGHHRMVSTFLSNRDYLREDEYEIKHWPYLDPVNKTGYLDINHEKGWYTPFDPRTHLRLSDIREFKSSAKEIFNKNPEKAIKWIEDNSSKYKIPITNIRTVADLATKSFLSVN